MSLINTQVQPFSANAFHNGEFIQVTEQSLKGKWSVLIFMPAAFTVKVINGVHPVNGFRGASTDSTV